MRVSDKLASVWHHDGRDLFFINGNTKYVARVLHKNELHNVDSEEPAWPLKETNSRVTTPRTQLSKQFQCGSCSMANSPRPRTQRGMTIRSGFINGVRFCYWWFYEWYINGFMNGSASVLNGFTNLLINGLLIVKPGPFVNGLTWSNSRTWAFGLQTRPIGSRTRVTIHSPLPCLEPNRITCPAVRKDETITAFSNN